MSADPNFVSPHPLVRHGLRLAVGLVALLLPACDWDGHFELLGYTTRPNYDLNIHSVYVPIFKNITLWRGLEFDATMDLIREIEAKTPYKVVSDRNCADTELVCRIMSVQKNLLNYNQLLEVREMETVMSVEVVWRDLHTGEVLSQPRPKKDDVYPQLPKPPKELGAPFNPRDNPPVPGVPTQPLSAGLPAPQPKPEDELPPELQHQEVGGLSYPEPPRPPAAVPVIIQAMGDYIPEEGMSTATAMKQCTQNAAKQIVNMMEKGW